MKDISDLLFSRSARSLLGLLLLLVFPVAATALQSGDFTYTLAGNSVEVIGYTGAGGSLTIPDAIAGAPVTSIGFFAFSGCSNLTSVTISRSVTSIGDQAFSGCRGLNDITVDPLNAAYSSLDGVVLNKEQTIIRLYPGGKAGSYKIPSSVNGIGLYAFFGCRGLTSVIIPSSVTSIEYGAFWDCSALTSVIIPSSVSSIESRAFYDCSGLLSVYFNGNPPTLGYENYPFAGTEPTIYYLPSAAGWGDTFAGRPTAIWGSTPAATVAILPTGLTTDRRASFSWQAVAGVDWYHIWINRDGQKLHSGWVQGTTWEPTADLEVANYTWYVQTWNSAGYGPWSAVASFSIEKILPDATSPVGPTGTQTLGQRRFEFSWQAADHASWYHVWVNRVGEGKYVSRWIPSSTTTWTPDMDFRGGEYRWWVAGWNADGYGTWSDGATFTVPSMRPDKITATLPVDGTTVAAGSINYQWNAESRATWYQLWCGRDGAPFVDNWYRSSDIVTGSTASTVIADHGWDTYSWYVRGWGPDGMGAWSDVGTFTYGKPVPVAGTDLLLTWDDSQTADAEWYQIWINDLTGGGRMKERAWWFKRDATTDAGSGNRSVPLTPALFGVGDYEWSIRAWSSAHGTGPWSEADRFTCTCSEPMNLTGVWFSDNYWERFNSRVFMGSCWGFYLVQNGNRIGGYAYTLGYYSHYDTLVGSITGDHQIHVSWTYYDAMGSGPSHLSATICGDTMKTAGGGVLHRRPSGSLPRP